MSGNSYRKGIIRSNKQLIATVLITVFIIATIGDYSIHKGVHVLAQEGTGENLTEKLNDGGMTLEKLSRVPGVKEAIIFVEETGFEEYTGRHKKIEELSIEELHETEEVQLMSIIEDDLEDELMQYYEIQSNYEVTIGDEVGVGSESTSVARVGASTNKDSTLMDVRNATKIIDESYSGEVVELTKENRNLLERLVQGEAGAEGFIGAALVAQAIRDTMVEDDTYELMAIKKKWGYSGRLTTKPNQDVLDAVKFIFDDGGYVVQHRIIYFYSYGNTNSGFHESQRFIIQHGGHRFFDQV